MTFYTADEVFAPPERERRTDRSRQKPPPHAAARQKQSLGDGRSGVERLVPGERSAIVDRRDFTWCLNVDGRRGQRTPDSAGAG